MMRLICAVTLLYLLHAASGKGLTMITRGCIVDYLRRNQLLNVSYAGPIPRSAMCSIVIESEKKSLIENKINAYVESDDDISDVEAFRECTKRLIARQNVSDILLKNHMYQVEEVSDRESLNKVVKEIFNNFFYLCSPTKMQNDFAERLPSGSIVAGYEKEISRFCLFNLLREKEVIERDFNVNFEIDEDDAKNVKCPAFVNEKILEEKSEAMFLLRPTDFYANELIWECAAEERMKIEYVRAYYRLIAYLMSNESEERKTKERTKFMEILSLANENASNCFKLSFSDEFEKVQRE